MKIAFLGAGSTVFAKNVIGDCMLSEALCDSEVALYDIDASRLEESRIILETINRCLGGKTRFTIHHGEATRKDALSGANFVINAVQVGGYDPCTITDFEIPKKYGLRQTIGDTIGIGGIMRALRTIPVLEDFARDMEEVCPDAWFLNYVNPMAIITGYMLKYANVKTIGLCHSVQVCVRDLLAPLGMEEFTPGHSEIIAGINHMAWLLEIRDKNGHDLYPEIRRRAKEMNAREKHADMVRYDYIEKFGYYCTESSEHNAEYNPYYIKARYPELIEKFNIPLDEWPRRCIRNAKRWQNQYEEMKNATTIEHIQSREYARHILDALVTGVPYKIGGNVLNTSGVIENLPPEACVEVPCMVDNSGIAPCRVGRLPLQLAALNATNIYPQLLTIEAARTRKRDIVYQAAMFDPRTAAELSLDDIVKMVDEMIEAHGEWMPAFH